MAAAAAEDGWEGTRVEVDAAHWKEEGEQQLELNRWRAHVAALKKILGRATVAAATAIGREACRLGGFDGNPSCHAVLHLDAPRSAMALAALQNAMGGTGTSIAKLNIGGHGPTWPVSSSSSCTPTPSSSQSCRAMQGRQSCNKRKLPCSNIMIFRSPLSRMILSPRLGTPHAPSPIATSKKRTSPSVTTYGGQRVLTEIDLNVSPCEERDIINLNVSSCEERDTIDLNAEPHELEEPNTEMEEENVEPVQLQGAQQRRTEVPLGIRKAVFEALLARSKSGYLKGHETGEVSTQFSVHFCTVQCIWAEERNVWIEEPLLMFRVKKSKRGRKKKEVDISKLR